VNIERFTKDGKIRYRLKYWGQELTVDALGLHDLYEYCVLHLQALEAEAKLDEPARYNAEMDERNRIIRESVDKPWLPLHDGE